MPKALRISAPYPTDNMPSLLLDRQPMAQDTVKQLRKYRNKPLPVNAWDPSMPKKVSITRQTLNPEDIDPLSMDELEDLRESLEAADLVESDLRQRRYRRSPPTGRSPTSGRSPTERLYSSADALSRAAQRSASMTTRRKPSESAILPITLDTKSIRGSVQPEALHEPVSRMSREERHRANKRMYEKMKAENHNLWVLLDASNRRANMMMETLYSEERRCRELEQRAERLQSTLDKLNTRIKTNDSATDEAVSEAEQVAAELRSIRSNISESRKSIYKMADQPLQVVDEKSEQTPAEQLAEQLDIRLSQIAQPQPLRPEKFDVLQTSHFHRRRSSSLSDLRGMRRSSGEDFMQTTPSLSPASSRNSSDLTSTPPTPPPKSIRRVDQTEVHPALREKADWQQPIYELEGTPWGGEHDKTETG